MLRNLPINALLITFAVLAATNILIYREILASSPLAVSVLEVGKERAILIRTPEGRTLLIDTGPDASILRALGEALPPWQRHIDAVILTSTKKAVAGGLFDVLARYKVGRQLTLADSRRLMIGEDTFVDIAVTKDVPAGVSLSSHDSVTKLR